MANNPRRRAATVAATLLAAGAVTAAATLARRGADRPRAAIHSRDPTPGSHVGTRSHHPRQPRMPRHHDRSALLRLRQNLPLTSLVGVRDIDSSPAACISRRAFLFTLPTLVRGSSLTNA
jgi:hypothetical protein